ncbi:MAG: tail fiber domain-containing protein, partial [Candidatus Margulisiibacteriota bacterium]
SESKSKMGWSGSYLLLNPTGGNVGIGTATPKAQLYVEGKDDAVVGKSDGAYGVRGEGYNAGVYGISKDYNKVFGYLARGQSFEQIGAYGQSADDNKAYLGYSNIDENLEAGVYSDSNGYGVYADAPKNYFSGDVGIKGKVGIGTDDPTEKLTIKDGNIAIYDTENPVNQKYLYFMRTGTGVNSTGYKFSWRKDDGSPRKNSVELDRNGNVYFMGGNVGIGTRNPLDHQLYVKGQITATGKIVGDIEDTSDIRLKKNINQLTGVSEKLKNIRGVSFEWNELSEHRKGKDIGMIAQEVEPYFPEMVGSDSGYKTLNYSKFTAVLIEAFKDQQKEIESLKKRIDEIEKK